MEEPEQTHCLQGAMTRGVWAKGQSHLERKRKMITLILMAQEQFSISLRQQKRLIFFALWAKTCSVLNCILPEINTYNLLYPILNVKRGKKVKPEGLKYNGL